MSKKEILKILKESAIKYKNNLQNQNLLILYEENKKIKYIEVVFLVRNFMHLTGIKCVDKNGICKNANQFFHACLKNKLSEKNIIIKPDGTTKLKLDVLSQFVAIDKKCKMIGTYNNTKNDLTTEMLIGNINICLGFVTNESEYYIPNTLLKEDIRKRVIKPFPIIGILKKKVDEEKYQIVTYMKKSMNMNKIKENKELYNKINIELLENYSTSKQLKTVSFYKVD